MWYHCSCKKGWCFYLKKGSQNCQGFCLFPAFLGWMFGAPEKCARWWFQIFFIFSPTWGRFPIWRSYFSDGVGSTTNQMWDSTRSWHPFATTIGCLETLLIAPRGGGIFGQLGPHDLIFLHPPKFFTWNLKRSPEIKEVPILETIIFIHYQIPCSISGE